MVSTSEHDAAVERLRASYAALGPDQPVRLAKRTTNLFRGRQAAATGLDVSGLTGVLDVDAEALTADVQGMCTYEDLVAATLPHGLMPYVVPQLRTISVCGGLAPSMRLPSMAPPMSPMTVAAARPLPSPMALPAAPPAMAPITAPAPDLRPG